MTNPTDTRSGPGRPRPRFMTIVVALLTALSLVACSDDEAGPADDTVDATSSTGGATDDESDADDRADDDDRAGDDGADDESDADESDTGESDDDDERAATGLDLPDEQVVAGSAAPVEGFAGARWTMTVDDVDTTSFTDPGDRPCAVVTGTLTLDELAGGRTTSGPGDLPVRLLLDDADRELRLSPFCRVDELSGAGALPLADARVEVGGTVPFYDTYDLGDQVPAVYVVGGGADDGWVSFAAP